MLQQSVTALERTQLAVLGRADARGPDSAASALRNHLVNVISWIPESLATCANVTPASRERATRTTSSRNSLGYGLGITTSFQPTLPGKPTQMSPIRAAAPFTWLLSTVSLVLLSVPFYGRVHAQVMIAMRNHSKVTR